MKKNRSWAWDLFHVMLDNSRNFSSVILYFNIFQSCISENKESERFDEILGLYSRTLSDISITFSVSNELTSQINFLTDMGKIFK